MEIPRTPEQAAAARRYYEASIDTLRAAAKGCGYALGVHGSIARDIDLIAVPWVEHATSAEQLLEAIRVAMQVATGVYWIVISGGRPKPHGRRAWSMMFVDDSPSGRHFTYIDLSVAPLREATPLATLAAVVGEQSEDT